MQAVLAGHENKTREPRGHIIGGCISRLGLCFGELKGHLCPYSSKQAMQAVIARDHDKALECRRGSRLGVSVAAANQLEAHGNAISLGAAGNLLLRKVP